VTLRPAGRLRRIAVFTIFTAVLSGGLALAAPGHRLVPDVLARIGGLDAVRDAPAARPAPVAPAPAPVALPGPPQAPNNDEPAIAAPRVPPHLDAFEPKTSGVPISAAVVMEFSQPMDQASVEGSFVILPKVDGRFSWRDQTLRFEPFRLTHGTTYYVDVAGRSALGKRLVGTRSWVFSTVAPPPDQIAPGPASIKVPILTYHYIRVNADSRDRLGFALSVTPADFAAQMDWLAQNGYHPITTEDLYAYLNRTRGLPSKPVILTFDDGYADFYTAALPILRSHSFKATAYIVSGFVGRGGYMTPDQIREADRSGIEIGSHSVTHANLARSSVANVRAEVGDSKRYLEQLLGHPVTAFCYPSGKHSGAVANEIAAAAYHNSTTTAFGFWHSLGDRYAWSRLRISGGEGLGDFAQAVASAS
jgi:peptidoglycan/xylan/chitin deacetylase (PgdA/CDA1 family)